MNPEFPQDKALAAVMAGMTPAQRVAFIMPILEPAFLHPNTAVDLRPGPTAGRMRRLAESGPKASLMEGEQMLMARLTRLVDDQPRDTAWRVTLCVDAAWDETLPAEEQWPCWHCTVLWGEKRKGMAKQAAPLFEPGRTRDGGIDLTGPWRQAWPNMRFRKAEALIARELAGVGIDVSLNLNTRDGLEAEAKRQGISPHLVVGFSGRKKLTVPEIHACLPPGWLEQLTHVRAG